MANPTKRAGMIQLVLSMRSLEILYKYALDGRRLALTTSADYQEISRFLALAEKILVGSGYMTELEIKQMAATVHVAVSRS